MVRKLLSEGKTVVSVSIPYSYIIIKEPMRTDIQLGELL